jgi:hypothetical protein
MATVECRLTTVDNPYDPFKEFDSWFLYDVEKGYNSSALLDRVADTSPELTDDETNEIIEQAIDRIIKYDFMNIYKKVKKEAS